MLNERVFVEFQDGLAKMFRVIENDTMIKICFDQFLEDGRAKNDEYTIHADKIHHKDVTSPKVVFQGDRPEKHRTVASVGYETLKGTLQIIDIWQTGIKLLGDGERKSGHALKIDNKSTDPFRVAIFFSTAEPRESDFRRFGSSILQVEDTLILKSDKGRLAFVAHTNPRAF